MQYIQKNIPKIIIAKKTLPLTDTQIKAAYPRDKNYSSFDSGGMYLLIRENISEIWSFKYTCSYAKKDALISFGSYPEVSLQQARKQRDEALESIKQDIDPQHYKAEQEQRKQEFCNNFFKG